MPYGRFGLWLDETMKAAGIDSQSELARRVDTSSATINRWMNDVNVPDEGHVAALARVLGVARLNVYAALGRMLPTDDSEYQDLLALMREMPPDDRRDVMEYARFRSGKRRGRTS